MANATNLKAMYPTVPLKLCVHCGQAFVSKPMGHNARFCGKKCKAKAKYRREKGSVVVVEGRKRHWKKVKVDKVLLEKHNKQGQMTASKTRQWLAAYKLERGCVDCGYKGHYAALQLDHEGMKTVAISTARSSVTRLMQEIEAGQCKVRCANCHAVKTWERKQLKKAAENFDV